MKRYFLGMAATYRGRDVFRHLFAVGRKKHCGKLCAYLKERYEGDAILCKNGRSALAIALKSYFEPGDAVIVNGFTCYAVYEAVQAAGLVPIFADITKEDLNFDINTLDAAIKSRQVKVSQDKIKGIIIQNSLGNPVSVVSIEQFAEKHGLTIIEDLAHCAGVKYPDGRECGTVGAAAAFSFGKDKVIDTISGGAVVLRAPVKHRIKAPSKLPKFSDHLRARFYPLFGWTCRKLTFLHLGGVLMKILVAIHFVEKSADNRLDLKRKISKFEAKLALKQFKNLRKSGELPIREFCFVKERDTVLKKLAKAGFYFDGLWYKQPVSPERYYKKLGFPEHDCPTAVSVAEHVINFPNYYRRSDLMPAIDIVREYLGEEEK